MKVVTHGALRQIAEVMRMGTKDLAASRKAASSAATAFKSGKSELATTLRGVEREKFAAALSSAKGGVTLLSAQHSALGLGAVPGISSPMVTGWKTRAHIAGKTRSTPILAATFTEMRRAVREALKASAAG